MRNLLTILFLIGFFMALRAQNAVFTIQKTLKWDEKILEVGTDPQKKRPMSHFEEAVYGERGAPTLPVFHHRWVLNSDGVIEARFQNSRFEPLDIRADADHKFLKGEVDFQTFVTRAGDKYFGNVRFTPLRQLSSGALEKLVDFELEISFQPTQAVALRGGPTGTYESVLKEGEIYKIAIRESGIYKLDYNYLKNDLKIANLDNIDPRTIKVYGNTGGMLPEANDSERTDDLAENSVWIEGEGDGKFNAGDFILFNGSGADLTTLDSDSTRFARRKNIYSNENFYFIEISAGNGKRVTNLPSLGGAAYATSSFDEHQRFEEDKMNPLASARCNCVQGSGKLWLGEIFNEGLSQRTYSDKFNFTGRITSEPLKLRLGFAAGSNAATQVVVSVGGQEITETLEASAPESYDGVIFSYATLSGNLNVSAASPEMKLKLQKIDPAVRADGWLDYIEVGFRKELRFGGGQMAFRDLSTFGQPSARYTVLGTDANKNIWNITKPQSPENQEFTVDGSGANFAVNTQGKLQQFIVFDKNSALLKPVAALGRVQNQNIHSFDNLDMLVVYHKDFEVAANKIADFRRSQTSPKLNVELAEITQIYNEFSSGRQDPAAIRDFARMLHKRTQRFKYMLIVGDGAFDYKRIYPLENRQPTDFIPTYQSDYSANTIDSYPSEDFFGLLSDNEGAGLSGELDISIGRLPVKTSSEADAVVDKIIQYETDPETFGDWRLRALFMGDNGDLNTHINDADGIANTVGVQHSDMNLEKLYIDAYRLEVSAGGTRAPQINDAIFQNQFKGALTMCYLGHGGPRGLAQERILLREDFATWRNKKRLPLLITATCTFSGFDDPRETSAGEAALLASQGGAVGLFSTTRAVYASSNEQLTRAVFMNLFVKENARAKTIGATFLEGKNVSRTGVNGQKFALLGDPSMRLALPRFQVATTHLNGSVVDSLNIDTLRALQSVTIKGEIRGDDGVLMPSFNGTIYVTVFDKVQNLRTLGQTFGGDQSFARDFRVQRNIVFKGAATVANGLWRIQFVVPRDIDYTIGNGKISYYATDMKTDAAGYFNNFRIGGTDSTAIADNKPPVVQVYLNDESFVTNGITNASPTLLVKLSDDYGINVAGTSIGHDLSGKLDEARNTISLNNFYEAVKDDSRSGIVRYPFNKLAVGLHKIRVKAWDVHNNSGEGYTEFVVAENGKGALAHVLNYPNPFSDRTYFQFEHSAAKLPMRVRVNIYAVSGRLVKSLEKELNTEGFRVNNELEWNGTDEYGNQLARGVYVYKVSTWFKNGQKQDEKLESDFEKLVIIR
jgi:hypothetical protein